MEALNCRKVDIMLAGSRLWGKEHEEKLSPVLYKKNEIYSYKNIASNLYEDLVNAVQKFGSNTAIITDDGQKISYTAFLEKVDQAAWYLKYEKKVAVGDRVVLLLYNTLEFCVLLYAISKIGGVVVPISTKYKPYELKMLLSRFPFSLLFLDKRIKEYGQILQQEFAGIEVVVAEDSLWFASGDAGEKNFDGETTGWEDDLVMMFTSGTTSVSKGVILTNFNILNAISSYEELLSVSEKDKTIIATPIYHIIGIVALLGLFVHCGGTVYLQLQFRPERVLKTILEEKITFMHSTPTVFVMLLNYKEKYPSLPSWRISLCGSSNTPPSIIERLHTWLPNMRFCPVYGLTESSSSGSVFLDNAVDSAEIGASGKPVPGIYMKILDEEGEECQSGQAGELLVKGCFVMDRYLGGEKSRESRWIKTGDIAFMSEGGYLHIVGRSKDMISRGGEKIYANEVENILYKMDEVVSAALIGIPDEKYGEIAVAVIKAKGALTEEDVKDWVGRHLAKYKIPAKVEFVEELPRTPNGKISKKILREQFGKN